VPKAHISVLSLIVISFAYGVVVCDNVGLL
jgi:hypothetical protein